MKTLQLLGNLSTAPNEPFCKSWMFRWIIGIQGRLVLPPK